MLEVELAVEELLPQRAPPPRVQLGPAQQRQLLPDLRRRPLVQQQIPQPQAVRVDAQLRPESTAKNFIRILKAWNKMGKGTGNPANGPATKKWLFCNHGKLQISRLNGHT